MSKTNGIDTFKASKATLAEFKSRLAKADLLTTIETLPDSIMQGKSKVKISGCTMDVSDGVPNTDIIEFGRGYSNEKLIGKSLAVVRVNIPFEGETFQVGASFEKASDFDLLCKIAEQKPNQVFDVVIRLGSSIKEGEDKPRKYVSLVMPKTKQVAAQPKAEQEEVLDIE